MNEKPGRATVALLHVLGLVMTRRVPRRRPGLLPNSKGLARRQPGNTRGDAACWSCCCDLENADRHAGGVTYLGLARSDDGFVITVDDNGPGISEEDRDRIFERFWRGAAARQHASTGTGLGLSLVSEHARLLGGSIRLAAAPSGGARFTVELPAAPWPS